MLRRDQDISFSKIWFNLYQSLGYSADVRLVISFSYFSQKTGFDISCKLSPLNKCQIMFSRKIKKNISVCCLLKFYPVCLALRGLNRAGWLSTIIYKVKFLFHFFPAHKTCSEKESSVIKRLCFMSKHCWMGGKQCSPWSDTSFCGIWSRSTQFASVCQSQYL